MENHTGYGAVEDDAFEEVDQSAATVVEVTETMWTIAAACADDEEAGEAFKELCRYLRIILHRTDEGDPELVALGLVEFVHELAASEDAETPRRAAVHVRRE